MSEFMVVASLRGDCWARNRNSVGSIFANCQRFQLVQVLHQLFRGLFVHGGDGYRFRSTTHGVKTSVSHTTQSLKQSSRRRTLAGSERWGVGGGGVQGSRKRAVWMDLVASTGPRPLRWMLPSSGAICCDKRPRRLRQVVGETGHVLVDMNRRRAELAAPKRRRRRRRRPCARDETSRTSRFDGFDSPGQTQSQSGQRSEARPRPQQYDYGTLCALESQEQQERRRDEDRNGSVSKF